MLYSVCDVDGAVGGHGCDAMLIQSSNVSDVAGLVDDADVLVQPAISSNFLLLREPNQGGVNLDQEHVERQRRPQGDPPASGNDAQQHSCHQHGYAPDDRFTFR